jgi:phenylacetic acid degradation operon negative regulatory protein
MLTEGTARIYGFPGDRGEWDGRWLLVLARVPEAERPARHRLRTRLAWAGLGSPSPGVWLTTHVDRLDEVRAVLAEAGVLDDAQLFVGAHVGGGAPAQLARQAWDLAGTEAGYEQFLDDFSDGNGGDPLTRLVALVHAWRRFPWIDPALPRELLPVPWNGELAAELFARRHEQWAPDARAEWQRLDA